MHALRLITSLVLTGLFTFAASPPLSIVEATHHLAGRLDYVAPGGTAKLSVNAPSDTPVIWYRNDSRIATTTGGVLSLSLLDSSQSGNYRATWNEAGNPVESGYLPLTVGPLPRSNFVDQTQSAGQLGGGSYGGFSARLLDDGRIFTARSSYGGVGINTTYSLISADRATTTRLYYSSWNLPSFAGLLGDGSFLITQSPYLHRSPDTPLPFTLPPQLVGDGSETYFQAKDLGNHRILLHHYPVVVGTERDGTVVFSLPAATLGFETIHDTTVLADGTIFIHGSYLPATPGESAPGATIRLTPDHLIDPTFSAIPNVPYHRVAQPLHDGSWARLTNTGYQRYGPDGKFVDERPVSFSPGATPYIAATGDVYGNVLGLGILRYRGTDLTWDPTFFLPQNATTSVVLESVLLKSDGTGYQMSSSAGIYETGFHPFVATVDNTNRLPVIARYPVVRSAYTSLVNSVHSWTNFIDDRTQAPRAGESFELHCAYYGTGSLDVWWIPLDGTTAPEPSPTGALVIPSFSAHYAGRYQFVVSNPAGQALGPIVDFRPTESPRLVNLSGRAQVDSGERTAVAGFVLRATPPVTSLNNAVVDVLLRGIGPSLADFDVSHPLADPYLILNESEAGILQQNDDWFDAGRLSYSVLNRVGAFIPVYDSLDSALYSRLAPGVYSALTMAKSGQAGIALTEIYLDSDGASTPMELTNLSLRGYTGTADKVLVGGFVIEDPDFLARPLRVLVRAVGPGLSPFGISSPLGDPTLKLFDAAGNLVVANTDWSLSSDAAEIATVAARLGAFALAPHSLDAAVLVTLPAGAYTAHVEPHDSNEGIALLEIYVVDSSPASLH